MQGTITRIIPNNGYCFIRGEDNVSRFAHARAFRNPLEFARARDGQGVEVDAGQDTSPTAKAGGLRAINIVLLPGGYAVPKLPT